MTIANVETVRVFQKYVLMVQLFSAPGSKVGSVAVESLSTLWESCPPHVVQWTHAINCDIDKLVSALSMLLVWISSVYLSDWLSLRELNGPE
jgi:hypothetical protein